MARLPFTMKATTTDGDTPPPRPSFGQVRIPVTVRLTLPPEMAQPATQARPFTRFGQRGKPPVFIVPSLRQPATPTWLGRGRSEPKFDARPDTSMTRDGTPESGIMQVALPGKRDDKDSTSLNKI